MVPLLIISHHRPIFALPNGRSAQNDFLDELWNNSLRKDVPYTKPLMDLWRADRIKFAFATIDTVLSYFNGLRSFFLRGYARRQCVQWVLEHQEKSGDWAGIFPPMHFGLLALILEGYDTDHSRIQRGLEAVERFAWEDDAGKRIQSCVSPVWDTILMTIGLCDAGVCGEESHLSKAVE